MIGEVPTQYAGIAPSDLVMHSLFSFTFKNGVFIGIHMGIGPPNVAFDFLPLRFKPGQSSGAGAGAQKISGVKDLHHARRLPDARQHTGIDVHVSPCTWRFQRSTG